MTDYTDVTGYVAPVGVSLLVNVTIFGVGMQIGGACASGTLYAVGSDASMAPVSFAELLGGPLGGLAVTLGVLAPIARVTVILGCRK